MRRAVSMSCLLAVVLVMVGNSSRTVAEDWPQWMGKQRDNIWREERVLEKFPEGGPKICFQTAIGGGYAGPAVAGSWLVVTDFVAEDNVKVDNFNRASFPGTERVHGVDVTTGKVVWTHSDRVDYTISYPAGPRCTPLIEEDRVYTLGAEGLLLCLNLADGTERWRKNLPEVYKTKTPLWGYAAHPLIDGPRLICVVGGEGTQTVAFDKMTGQEIWRQGTATEPGYSPPTWIEHGGVRQLILANPQAVHSVNSETGAVYWTQSYEATNGSIIMSPLLVGDYLFVGGYSNHNLLLQLNPNKPEATVVSRDVAKKFLSPVNVQPFVQGNVVIGMDQGGDLMAFEVPSGKRLWQTPELLGKRSEGSETAFLVRHRDRCFIFTEQGEIVIAKVSTEGLEVLDRAKVMEPTNNAFGRQVVWCAPAFANRKMYVRNDQQLICIDLSAP
ncbi:MAG: PQQ-binding-like beta-propeller repeat protein [Pirellulaceae bacterium]